MNIKKIIKRIVCLGISSVLITSNSFAEQIITNSSKKPQKQLKNNTQKPRKNLLLEKIEKLTPHQKKHILFEALGWGSSVLNVFLIKKLWNILFPTKLDEPKNQVKDNTDDPKNKDKSDQNIRDNYKNKSPFANLEWENGNCYINATLQILYEDPEFRKYVEDRANCKENHEEKYVYLSQIFKDMDVYTGGTVPHNQARKDFEKALGHIDSGYCDDFFDTVFPSAIKYCLCNDCDTNKFEVCGTSIEIEEYFKEFSGNSLWFLCDATSTEGRKNLPLELTFANNKKFKLKGIVMYTTGHYNAYKADTTSQWYFIDDYHKKNQKYDKEPNFKTACTNDQAVSPPGVVLAYYQAV